MADPSASGSRSLAFSSLLFYSYSSGVGLGHAGVVDPGMLTWPDVLKENKLEKRQRYRELYGGVEA